MITSHILVDFYQKYLLEPLGVTLSLMPNPFSVIEVALEQNMPEVRAKTWRESLRRRLPADRMHEILADLAEGKAWMAELPDGRQSAPVLPSTDVRLRAIMFLHEALYGKAVAQTEIQKAEQEAKEFEAIRALTDDELEHEATRVLATRKRFELSPPPVDAELVEPTPPIPEREVDLATTIWLSTTHTEQDQ